MPRRDSAESTDAIWWILGDPALAMRSPVLAVRRDSAIL
jgi:hypothetical protein